MRPLRRLFASSPCRPFSHTSPLPAGHNKWSKIRHDKAAADAKKTALRDHYTKNLALYSRLHGPDPQNNPPLAAALAAARKAGVPRAKIEAAVDRGQGRSPSGAPLEPVVFEARVPPSVALLVEAETPSRLRTLQHLSALVKKSGGLPAASRYFFERRGRVVLAAASVRADDLLDAALEAGAEDLVDVEDDNSASTSTSTSTSSTISSSNSSNLRRILVWTPPERTAHVCRALADAFSLPVLRCDIIWVPNPDARVSLFSAHLDALARLLSALRDAPDVQAVYCNARRGPDVSDDEWGRLGLE